MTNHIVKAFPPIDIQDSPETKDLMPKIREKEAGGLCTHVQRGRMEGHKTDQ
jgi:hypothetical protein